MLAVERLRVVDPGTEAVSPRKDSLVNTPVLSDFLAGLDGATAPFASVALDATRVDRAGGDDVVQRWRAQADRLVDLGAPQSVLEAMEPHATAATGLGGELTRVVVASGDSVVVDVVLPGRPPRDEALFGPVPHLMPVVRALSGAMPYAVARVDRAGADIEVVGLAGATEKAEVEGGHDLLHKVGSGGWSQRRYQARVEDSWEHNAAAVGGEVESVVRRHRPDVVLVGGDEHAVEALTRHLDGEALPAVVKVEGLSRAEGVHEDTESEAVSAALERRRAQRRAALVDEFSEEVSRQQRAVEGLGAVVSSLRRGQVERLLLNDDPTSTLELWAGEQPLQLGVSEQDSRDAGAVSPRQSRADAVIAWALVGSAAEATLLDPGEVQLTEGVAALLRWSDEATEHGRVPSMPGHGEAPGSSDDTE